jgi:hypothetical protein
LKYFYDLFQPGTLEQSEKLRVIVANLEEQKAGYVNLLNLITVNSLFDFVGINLFFNSLTNIRRFSVTRESKQILWTLKRNIFLLRRVRRCTLTQNVEERMR